MTLSTATPSLVAMAPALTPMTISLTAPLPPQSSTLGYAEVRRDLAMKQRKVEEQRAQNSPAGGKSQVAADAEFDRSLNDFANSIQVLDLVADQKLVKDGPPGPRLAGEEGLAVTYTIASK